MIKDQEMFFDSGPFMTMLCVHACSRGPYSLIEKTFVLYSVSCYTRLQDCAV